MTLVQSAIMALMTVSMPHATFDYRNPNVIRIQGTDKLPGGVEHIPSGGTQPVSPSLSTPAPIPDLQPSLPEPQLPTDAESQSAPKPVSPPTPSTEKKSKKKKSKKSSADHNYKSMKPVPETHEGPGKGGDDSTPGGVERAPSNEPE